MRWLVRIGLGLGVLFVVLVVAGITLRPYQFPAQLAEPGPTGQRIEENGMLANYFPAPSGEPAPGILVLGGSEGGLGNGMRDEALEFQAQGYSALQVAYHHAPGKPKDLVNIPLEDFYAGLDWLKAQPEVDPERLAVYGISKGAEAGLVMAARRDDIDAAVLGVPSSVVWAGIDWRLLGMFGLLPSRSSWSEGGEPLPFLPYGAWNEEQGIASVYISGLESLGDYPEAIIRVEEASGPILLVCGGLDNIWPSCPMSEAIVARAEEKNGPEVTLLSYPEAGHAAIGIPSDEPGEAFGGGTWETDNAAREDSWPQVLAFLEAHLSRPASAEDE
ncbi:MAG: acyl-CoA thioester hydrolase/BAAT C-terminal domain-containing protein [Pseudomonadota bacterium]